MNDLVFHLEKYLEKFQIESSDLDEYDDRISATGIKIRYSFNYDTNKSPCIEVLTSIPGKYPFIFTIQKGGGYIEKRILPVHQSEDGGNTYMFLGENGDQIIKLLFSILRISNLADDENYQEAVISEKENEFEKFIFISEGTLFSPSHIAPFKVYENNFCCLLQYFFYYRFLFLEQYELSRMILNEWSGIDIRKCEIILKNSSLQKWINESYRLVYKGIHSKFTQNPLYMDELIATRKGVFIYSNESDLHLGTGFTEMDSINEFKTRWKGNNLYGYSLGVVRDDIFKTK